MEIDFTNKIVYLCKEPITKVLKIENYLSPDSVFFNGGYIFPGLAMAKSKAPGGTASMPFVPWITG
jgi:hypothetical protein